MTRAYNVIDADGHILEPLDLWDRYIDPESRERPRLTGRRSPELLHTRWCRGRNVRPRGASNDSLE